KPLKMKPSVPLYYSLKRTSPFFISCLLVLFLGLFSVDLLAQAGCNTCSCPSGDPGNITNPDLDDICDGFNVVLVLDESSSITFVNGAAQQVRDAVDNFLGSVVCGDLNVRVMKFSTTAEWLTNEYQPFAVARNSLNLNTQYNPVASPIGYTNWHAALNLIWNMGASRPEMVLFWTDGEPTAYGLSSNPNNVNIRVSGNSPSGPAPRYEAMWEANRLKTSGVHMFVLGIGNVSQMGLESISGQNQYGPGKTLLNSDYALTTFGDIADDMQQLAYTFCPSVSCASTDACPMEPNSGTIEIEIFTGPLSYEFSFIGPNGEIDSGEADEQLKTYSNLGPGQYTFTLIDVNGCPINQTCEVIISEPLVCTIGQVSHIDCNNLTGSVIINASGGSGVYRYSLDGQNFQVDNEFTGLSAG